MRKPRATSCTPPLRAALAWIVLGGAAAVAAWTCAQEAGGEQADSGGSPAGVRLTRTHFPKFFLEFSPDGSHIVYARHYSNRRASNQVLVGLHIVRSDGTDDRRILEEYDRDVQIQEHPRWSPDGRRLALSGGGNDTGNAAKDSFLCDVDAQFRVTNLRKLLPGRGVTVGEEPCWSPDGQQLAAVTTARSLITVDADGKDQTPVIQVSGLYCHQPAWSPDGEWIAFASDRAGNNVEIYKVRWDGTDLTRLTYDPATDSRPRWSPDGQWILFTSNRTGNSDVFVMRADGSGVRNLTDHPALDDHAAWAPDGRSFAFVSMRDGGFDIYRAELPDDVRIGARPVVRSRAFPQAAGLVAHYDFEEGDGSVVRDRAGRHPMTLVGARIVGAPGRRALSFDGAGAYASCGNAADLRLAQAMTLSLWVRPAEASGNGYLLSKHGYNLYIGTDRIVRFETRTANDQAWDTLAAAAPLSSGAWTWVAAVFDPKAGTESIYLNGQLSAAHGRSDGSIGAAAAYPLELGHYNLTRTQHFRGELAEIRLYAVALDAESVARAYKEQQPRVAAGAE